MTTITKERIDLFIKAPLENGLTRGEQMELARIALASMDAKPVAFINGAREPALYGEYIGIAVGTHLYTAPPVQETGVYKDMLNIIGLLENNEWAEHCTSTVLGSLLESEITRLVGKEQPVPVMPPGLHPDTQKLVADFSTDLAEKLYKAQLKYGYDADWKQDNWSAQCLAHFHQHIAKGDPRDVAAYCAFMWYHDWKTEPATAPLMPEECPADISVLMASHSDALFNDDDAQEIWNACRAVMLQNQYRDLSQPVDPQVTEYEQIMLQAGWVMVPVEPTDEMIAAAMECDDVVFDSKDPTAFCVQFREIYCAMVDAAPKPEGNNG
ncbi:hypothetical protein FH551_23925 [Salmonella enterica]|nr:hypothetical protein [Salmonella enterica]